MICAPKSINHKLFDFSHAFTNDDRIYNVQMFSRLCRSISSLGNELSKLKFLEANYVLFPHINIIIL